MFPFPHICQELDEAENSHAGDTYAVDTSIPEVVEQADDGEPFYDKIYAVYKQQRCRLACITLLLAAS